MPPRLSAYICERIIRLWQQGKTAASIMKELRKDDISSKHCMVTRRIFQWTKGGRLQDQRRPGQPSVITEEISEYLDKLLEAHAALANFHRLIAKKLSLQIPAPTIRRFSG